MRVPEDVEGRVPGFRDVDRGSFTTKIHWEGGLRVVRCNDNCVIQSQRYDF